MWGVTEIPGDYRGVCVSCWRIQSVDAFRIMVLLWCLSLDMCSTCWACAGSSQPRTCPSRGSLGFKIQLIWSVNLFRALIAWHLWSEQASKPQQKANVHFLLSFPLNFPPGVTEQSELVLYFWESLEESKMMLRRKDSNLSKKIPDQGMDVFSFQMYPGQFSAVLSVELDELNSWWISPKVPGVHSTASPAHLVYLWNWVHLPCPPGAARIFQTYIWWGKYFQTFSASKL